MSQGFESSRAYSRPMQRLADSLGELSVMGRLYATTSAVSLGASATWAAVAAEKGGTTDGVVSGVETVIGIGFALLASRDRGRSVEALSRQRRFSDRSDFGRYVHTDNETGMPLLSPFSVTVVGIKNEMLGVGELIGAVDPHPIYGGAPVVSIEDPKSPNGSVELLGSECFWTPIDGELVDVLSTEKAGQAITSAYEYAQQLDRP